jgi:hypothetical protein
VISKIYSRTAIVLSTTILCSACLEVAAGAVLSRMPDPLVSKTEKSSYYSGRQWAKTYFRELKAVWRGVKYHPYTIWRLPPFRGQYINIDAEGLRATPGSCQSPTVWMFGGSTMWGLGVPDDGAVSVLLAELHGRVEPVSPREATGWRLSGVLDDHPELAYLDWHHLTVEANEIVAKAMLRTMAKTL